jgi:hypothetical protein
MSRVWWLIRLYQMELQTLFEMEDIAVSESVYHVVSSVPDFQTKLADSRPARLALLCLFKNGGGERWKNDIQRKYKHEIQT